MQIAFKNKKLRELCENKKKAEADTVPMVLKNYAPA